MGGVFLQIVFTESNIQNLFFFLIFLLVKLRETAYTLQIDD